MVWENINALDSHISANLSYLPNENKEKNSVNNLIFVKRSDGKVVIMSRDSYIRYLIELSKYMRPQKLQPEKPSYELGLEKNGVRVIDVDNVSNPIHRGTSAPRQNSCSPEQIQEYKDNIAEANGQIDDFKQGKRGDCYLLAAIKSIVNTEDGQEILKKNVHKNPNGSYTVTLPGAVAARNHYINTGYGDKCAITGKYTITASAIEKAKTMSGKSYAYGDIEVIALELAMEAFRAEIVKTNKALGKKSERYIAGQIGPMSESDTLSGGMMYDAVFILTGQKSDLYLAKKSKRKHIKLYKPGEYGYLGQEMKNSKGSLGRSAAGIVEVNHIYNKESDLQRMLDKYKGKEKNYSITVGVIVAHNGPDGSTKAGGGHALTVTKITDTYVEVVNPWDTTKPERIPRGDFEAMTVSLNVAPVSEKHFDNFNQENGIVPNNNDLSSNTIQNFLHNILFPGLFNPQLKLQN